MPPKRKPLPPQTPSAATRERAAAYARPQGKDINQYIKDATDKKARSFLKKTQQKAQEQQLSAARAEMLLLEDAGYLEAEGMEKTFKFTQDQIVRNVDATSASKRFSLTLDDYGPYHFNYTRNGRHLLIGGKKGHVGAFDWQTTKLHFELFLNETVRDVQWLHNDSFLAIAQRKYVYIYDRQGTEIHCLKQHIDVNRLEFLPYHFLLVSVGNAGYLKYHDVSVGEMVAEHRTHLGPCTVMQQNPHNAIINLGHTNGTVTMWSPTTTTPIVKMLCHKGPISALTIDNAGRYLTTAGMDGKMKIWDVRTYKLLHEYYTITPPSSLCVSQLGLLGVGFGPNVQVWKDAFQTKQQSPYMTQLLPSQKVVDLQFCPYDDVLGVGHTGGFMSMLIPGSGEPNIDSFEVNPYETKKQKQEMEVRQLMEKLQPEMISIDPSFIGTFDKGAVSKLKEIRKTEFEANHPKLEYKPKKKNRGRNTTMKRYLKKRHNVVDEKKVKIQDTLRKQKEAREQEANGNREGLGALSRFGKKRQ